MKTNIYINSIKQISAQKALCEEWFEQPIFYTENFVKSLDEDYKQYFSANEVRRLGKILKRALLTSRKALEDSEISIPDAIITGTGLGCLENTELFLDRMIHQQEQLLNPTQFMNSTHNTISSLIAIDTGCTNYNSTHTHKGVSFEHALLDGIIRLSNKTDKASVLVCGHDEMTQTYFNFLQKCGYLGQQGETFAGETSVAMVLSNKQTETSICKIEAIETFYGQSSNIPDIFESTVGIDAIMTGVNGLHNNDRIYSETCTRLFPNIPILQYKNIFGESYTASALGIYAAAQCIKKNTIPHHLNYGDNNIKTASKIMCYNHFEGKNHAFVLLSKK